MKVRRKIMALGTALAMAFVMIASLVMVTDVKADNDPTPITSVNVSIKVPEANTVIKKVAKESDGYTYYVQEPRPEFTVSGDGFEQIEEANAWIVDPDNILKDEQSEFEGQVFHFYDLDPENKFYGTMESGKDYYAVVELYADTTQYSWPENCNVNVTGGTFYSFVKNPGQYSGNAYVVVKVSIPGGGESGGGGDQGGDDQGGGSDQGGSADQGDSGQAATSTSNIVTLTNGASATVAQADNGTVSFRYEKDFSYFENGGKLYIDGEEVPSDQYTARQGSTIITLLKQYASKLLDGKEHTVKAVFKDGEAIESKITVTPSAAAKATTATTTKVASPKTADVLPIAGIALVFVGASAIGVIAYRRKNN